MNARTFNKLPALLACTMCAGVWAAAMPEYAGLIAFWFAVGFMLCFPIGRLLLLMFAMCILTIKGSGKRGQSDYPPGFWK